MAGEVGSEETKISTPVTSAVASYIGYISGVCMELGSFVNKNIQNKNRACKRILGSILGGAIRAGIVSGFAAIAIATIDSEQNIIEASIEPTEMLVFGLTIGVCTAYAGTI